MKILATQIIKLRNSGSGDATGVFERTEKELALSGKKLIRATLLTWSKRSATLLAVVLYEKPPHQ